MGFGTAKAHDCCTVFLLQDARRGCSMFALLNRLSISRLKSFNSSGLREVTITVDHNGAIHPFRTGVF